MFILPSFVGVGYFATAFEESFAGAEGCAAGHGWRWGQGEGRAEWVNGTVLAGCWICGFLWSDVDVVLNICVDEVGWGKHGRVDKCGSCELVEWIVTSVDEEIE